MSSSLNANILRSDGHFYNIVANINDDDLFLSKYTPTNDHFALRRSNLEEMKHLDFLINSICVTKLLKHVNILPFLSIFIHDNELWTVSPYAEYGSAHDVSKPIGIPELAIAFITRDVLNGLEYLHKRGIIHRAIRGSHVLITAPSGRCLLSGLKYSTNVMIDGKWQTSIHHFPVRAEGNLNWLAPEVLEQNLMGYNHKSDIYSLGIMCCELSNGIVPFQDLEPTEMLLDKLTGNFPRPLDSSCEEIMRIPTDDMTSDMKEKYETYKNRTFSSSFRSFCVDLCLHFEPFERPDASQLLNHSFIKQIKKCGSSTNLLSLIPNNNSPADIEVPPEVPPNVENPIQVQNNSNNLTDELNWNFS